MEYSPDDPAAAFPIGRGRRDCIACLQAEGNDKPTGRMQYLVAEILAHILLSQQGMPITAAVEYEAPELPAVALAGRLISSTCHSCMQTITIMLQTDSLDGFEDTDRLALCQACLRQSTGNDMVSASNTCAISYSLASKLLGQVIPSPTTREGSERGVQQQRHSCWISSS